MLKWVSKYTLADVNINGRPTHVTCRPMWEMEREREGRSALNIIINNNNSLHFNIYIICLFKRSDEQKNQHSCVFCLSSRGTCNCILI